MKEQLISLAAFFDLRKTTPILDARSEGEFMHSRIPSAINLPILSDQERKIVGTLYKESGSESAILKGFELVGPRFHAIQKKAMGLVPNRKVIVYCWRGGMRSQILSWLLGMLHFEVFRLEGGYKTYRSFTFEQVRKERKWIVLSGKTGTGKTLLLHRLQEKGEQIIDLEKLACHKGSAFGGIGQPAQPSVEQFENKLAEAFLLLDPTHPCWIENESRKIGRAILPEELFNSMQSSPHVHILKTETERIQHIEEAYAQLPTEKLQEAILKLQKKLGGLRCQEALTALQEGEHTRWISILLHYYDKSYAFGIQKYPPKNSTSICLSGLAPDKQLVALLQLKNNLNG